MDEYNIDESSEDTKSIVHNPGEELTNSDRTDSDSDLEMVDIDKVKDPPREINSTSKPAEQYRQPIDKKGPNSGLNQTTEKRNNVTGEKSNRNIWKYFTSHRVLFEFSYSIKNKFLVPLLGNLDPKFLSKEDIHFLNEEHFEKLSKNEKMYYLSRFRNHYKYNVEQNAEKRKYTKKIYDKDRKSYKPRKMITRQTHFKFVDISMKNAIYLYRKPESIFDIIRIKYTKNFYLLDYKKLKSYYGHGNRSGFLKCLKQITNLILEFLNIDNNLTQLIVDKVHQMICELINYVPQFVNSKYLKYSKSNNDKYYKIIEKLLKNNVKSNNYKKEEEDLNNLYFLHHISKYVIKLNADELIDLIEIFNRSTFSAFEIEIPNIEYSVQKKFENYKVKWECIITDTGGLEIDNYYSSSSKFWVYLELLNAYYKKNNELYKKFKPIYESDKPEIFSKENSIKEYEKVNINQGYRTNYMQYKNFEEFITYIVNNKPLEKLVNFNPPKVDIMMKDNVYYAYYNWKRCFKKLIIKGTIYNVVYILIWLYLSAKNYDFHNLMIASKFLEENYQATGYATIIYPEIEEISDVIKCLQERFTELTYQKQVPFNNTKRSVTLNNPNDINPNDNSSKNNHPNDSSVKMTEDERRQLYDARIVARYPKRMEYIEDKRLTHSQPSNNQNGNYDKSSKEQIEKDQASKDYYAFHQTKSDKKINPVSSYDIDVEELGENYTNKKIHNFLDDL